MTELVPLKINIVYIDTNSYMRENTWRLFYEDPLKVNVIARQAEVAQGVPGRLTIWRLTTTIWVVPHS